MPLSLILCDIDFFKKYNDTYGHQAGDACLRKVANALTFCAKRSVDLVARYGGEEFAVILPNTTTAGASQVAEEIREFVNSLKIPHAQSAVSEHVTLSLGVASMEPTLDTSPSMLIATADAALYRAKAAGRNKSFPQFLSVP
jgi:diguanylate cyclase (GGDEF)-like protein